MVLWRRVYKQTVNHQINTGRPSDGCKGAREGAGAMGRVQSEMLVPKEDHIGKQERVTLGECGLRSSWRF